jgi:hypothetical protein
MYKIFKVGKKLGWSYNNIIMQMVYSIADKKEIAMMEYSDDFPEVQKLYDIAKKAYNDYMLG